MKQVCPDCGWEAPPAEMARHMEEHVEQQQRHRRAEAALEDAWFEGRHQP